MKTQAMSWRTRKITIIVSSLPLIVAIFMMAALAWPASGQMVQTWKLQEAIDLADNDVDITNEWWDAEQTVVNMPGFKAFPFAFKQNGTALYFSSNRPDMDNNSSRYYLIVDKDNSGGLSNGDFGVEIQMSNAGTVSSALYYTYNAGSWGTGTAFATPARDSDGDNGTPVADEEAYVEFMVPISDVFSATPNEGDTVGIKVTTCDANANVYAGWPDYAATPSTCTTLPSFTGIPPQWGILEFSNDLYPRPTSTAQWDRFPEIPEPREDTWPGYTYRGQEIIDYETSHDPSHGPAAVQPDEIDIASDIDGFLGDKPSALMNYTVIPSGYPGYYTTTAATCTANNGAYVGYRTWTDGDPTFKDAYKSRNWNVLIDVSSDPGGLDGYKDFWLNLAGWWDQSGDPDALLLYYEDVNNQMIQDMDAALKMQLRADSLDADGDFNSCDEYTSGVTAAPIFGTGPSSYVCYQRIPRGTEGDYDYELNFQIPVRFLDIADDGLENGSICVTTTRMSMFYSTSASNTNPLQKDWMGDFCGQAGSYSTDQPLCFGDPVVLDPPGNYVLSPLAYSYVVGPGAVVSYPHVLTDKTTNSANNTYYFQTIRYGVKPGATGSPTCSGTPTLYVDTNQDGIRQSTETTVISQGNSYSLADGAKLYFVAEIVAQNNNDDNCNITITVSDASSGGNLQTAVDNHEVNTQESAVKINELMYDPATGNEWLEITNTSRYFYMSLDTWEITDNDGQTFAIPAALNDMPPIQQCPNGDEARLIVVFGTDPGSATDTDWSDCVATIYTANTDATIPNFDNAADDVSLCIGACSSSSIVDYVSYGGAAASSYATSASIWPVGDSAVDVATGHSLSRLRAPALTDGYDDDAETDWYEAYAASPGEENQPSILINEVEIQGATVGWAELYVVNVGVAGFVTYDEVSGLPLGIMPSAIDLSGYKLTNDHTGAGGTALATEAVNVYAGDYVRINWSSGTDEADSYCFLNDCGSYRNLYVPDAAPNAVRDELLLISPTDPPTASDEVWLDAVIWTYSGTNDNVSALTGNTLNGQAVPMWSGAVENTDSYATQGTTFGRDAISTDTNSNTDWDSSGGKDAVNETSGAQNIGILINEVMFNTSGNDWVEIYCAAGVSGAAYRLQYGDANASDAVASQDFSLTCSAGQYVRLNITAGRDLSSSYGAISLCSNTGGTGCTNLTVVDFLAYGQDPDATASPNDNTLDDNALAASIWTDTTAVSITGLLAADSIGRSMYETDTNTAGDWTIHGGVNAVGITPTGAASGTASYVGKNIGKLIVNEIMFTPDTANSGFPWIELYNPNSVAVDLNQYVIQDGDGNSYTIDTTLWPALADIPAGGYLVIYFDDGDDAQNDYLWSDGDHAELHINFAVGSADTASLNTTDSLALCQGACSITSIVDFVAWGGSPGGALAADDAYEAVQKVIWTVNTYVNTGSMAISLGESIGRDMNETDTNAVTTAEWNEHGGNNAVGITPGRRNVGGLIINEVAFNETTATNEWIELYNPTNATIDFTTTPYCISVTDGNGCIASVTTGTLMPGGYLQVTTGALAATQAISLYAGVSSCTTATCTAANIMDFVAYGANAPGTNATDAVAAGLWPATTGATSFVYTGSWTISTDETIGRSQDETDTNTNADWDQHGGVNAVTRTPAAKNLGGLIINEVVFAGNADWLEFYNPTATAVDLSTTPYCVSMTDAVAPSTTCNCLGLTYAYGTNVPAGGYLRVDVNLGTGSNTPISIYNNTTTCSATTIMDFVHFTNSTSYYPPGANAEDAVAAGLWPSQSTFVDAVQWGLATGESVGRDKEQTDTNDTADWWDHGGINATGITPNARNLGFPIVNEISFNATNDWIELYNPSSSTLFDVDLCISIDDGATCLTTVTRSFAANEYYLVQLTGDALPATGAISVYGEGIGGTHDATTIGEFVAYGAANPSSTPNAAGSAYDAVTKGIWPVAYPRIDTSIWTISPGETIGRDQNQTDSNGVAITEWLEHGGPNAVRSSPEAQNLNTSALIINEISYNNGAAAQDWIEIYNAGTAAYSGNLCVSLDDGAGCVYSTAGFPSLAVGAYYKLDLGVDALPATAAISLYSARTSLSAANIVDFVAYGTIAPGANATDAVTANMWPNTNTFVNTALWTISTNETLGRDMYQIDTNITGDWMEHGGINASTQTIYGGASTLGHQNVNVLINEISYLNGTADWVEFYNPTTAPFDLSAAPLCLSTNDGLNCLALTYTYGTTLPAGGYLRVNLADGTILAATGALSLYSNTTTRNEYTITDFVAYGIAPGTTDNAAGSGRDAITAGMWPSTGTNYVNLGPAANETIGRDKMQTDTNATGDWSGTGGAHALGETPNARNVSTPLINEVSYLDSTHDWIELYNPTGVSVTMDLCISINDGTLPTPCLASGSYTIPANGYYVVTLTGDALPNGGAGISLYAGSSGTFDQTTIGDFVAYGSSPGANDYDAVQADIWDDDAYVSATISADETIGRNMNQVDTDTPADWDDSGGVHAYSSTSGAQNIGVLINEIAYREDSGDWFEFYNPTSVAQNVCISLDGGTTCTNATVGTALYSTYAIVLNDVDSISIYRQTATCQAGTTSGCDGTNMLDFVAFGTSSSGEDADAISAGIWTSGAYVNETVNANETIGRDMNQTDTDAVGDWDETGGINVTNAIRTDAETPGARNYQNPTYAVVTDLQAYVAGNEVIVGWETATEQGVIGFYLERQHGQSDHYVRLNETLIPAILVSSTGGMYQTRDPQAKAGETYTYRVIEVNASGDEVEHGPFTVIVAAGSLGTRTLASGEEYRREARIDSAQQMPQYAKMAMKSAAPATKRIRTGNTLKITVAADGLYRVSVEAIAAAMGVTSAEVAQWIQTKKLALSSQDKEVAWLPDANNSGLIFYGEAMQGLYSRQNVYWLRQQTGLRMKTSDLQLSVTPVEGLTFIETRRIEQNLLLTVDLISDPELDPWMWNYFYAGFAGLDRRVFPLNIEQVAATSASATLKVFLYGYSNDRENIVKVMVNDAWVGSTRWYGRAANIAEFTFPQTLLKEGANQVTFIGERNQTTPYTLMYVDRFEVTYHRTYQAVQNRLFASDDGHPVVTMSGFTNASLQVLDVTNPALPILVNTNAVSLTANGYQVSFTPLTTNGKYLAVTNDQLATAVSVTADAPSNLKDTTHSVDYLVITTGDLAATAQTLAAYRQAQGLSAMVVDVEDVYDEFNHGVSSPEAIQAFLAYAYCAWTVTPRYVVLAGEATYDYLNYKGLNENLIPTFMAGSPYGVSPSDTLLADVVGNDGVPEMAIGRLPVMTSAELAAMIAKIKTYEAGLGSGSWQNQVFMIADNPDSAGNFPADSDRLAALIPPTYTVQKVHLLTPTPLATARQQVLQGIQNGAFLMNYIGHAAESRLASEGLLQNGNVASLLNGSKLPIGTFMACLVGNFGVPGNDTLSERLVLKGDGGMIAVWAASGLSLNSFAMVLNQKFFESVFVQGEAILGEAIMSALQTYVKAHQEQNFILNMYNLLGDPALQIRPGGRYVPMTVRVPGACTAGPTKFITIRKAGNGTGTILAGDQECGPDCQEMTVPYVKGGSVLADAIPSEGSYFAGWQNIQGQTSQDVHFAPPQDVVIAIFKKQK